MKRSTGASLDDGLSQTLTVPASEERAKPSAFRCRLWPLLTNFSHIMEREEA